MSYLEGVGVAFGSLVALGTLIAALREYKKQGALKRVEWLNTMRRKFKENERFAKIRGALLNKDEDALSKIPLVDKTDFLGFFEEISLLVNSKMIRKAVASQMFAYYAITAWESSAFEECKEEVDGKPDVYWRIFEDFVKEMQKEEKRLSCRRFTNSCYRI